MSWHGTVRCSFCGQKGHNRLGCPERARHARENPNSYEGRKWHREQAERAERIANRACSYCKGTDHNRRGCKTLKQDKKMIAQRQSRYIDEFINIAYKAGIGPGSLLKVPTGHIRDHEGIWTKGLVVMITEPAWDNIDFTMQDQSLHTNWRYMDKGLFSSRIVSTFGYSESDGGWRGPPKHNDIQAVSLLQCHQLLADILHPDADFGADAQMAGQLVGPSHARFSYPSRDFITNDLQHKFHLNPGKRADEWDKLRIDASNEIWSGIYTEQGEVK